jgi:hypothetical protein
VAGSGSHRGNANQATQRRWRYNAYMLLSALEIGSALMAIGTLVAVNIRWFREGHRDRFLPFV